MTWGAVAGAVIGVVGGAITSKKASDSASKGQKKALAAQQRLLGPYAEAGHAALPALQAFVNQGSDYSNTQAYKDIVNSAKAGGMSLSGNRLTALTDYYATNFRPQRLNELMAIPKMGANAAAGQATNEGNLYSGIGASNAAGWLGVGNSIQNGLNNYAFMQAWQNQNSGSSSVAGNSQVVGTRYGQFAGS